MKYNQCHSQPVQVGSEQRLTKFLAIALNDSTPNYTIIFVIIVTTDNSLNLFESQY